MLVLVLVVLAAGIWATKGADVPAAAGPGAAGQAVEEAPVRSAPPGEDQVVEAGGEPAAQSNEGQAADGLAARTGSAGEGAGEPGPPGETAYPLAASRSAIDRSGGASETMRVTVYFVDFDAGMEALQPVEILVPFSVTPVKVSVEQLLHPPEELGLFSEFPPGTTARGFNLEDGVAVVDLSGEVEGVRGERAVSAVVATLVYTLTEIPGVEAVQLWAEGRPAVLDGFAWSSPLTRADVAAWQLFRVEPVIAFSGG